MRCSRLVLCLFLLFNLPLFLPLGKLPLPFLTLEKRLYLREQDAGQGLHFVIGYPGAVVVDFPLGAAPVLEPFLVEQVSLRYGAVPSASARGHIEEDRIRRFAV